MLQSQESSKNNSIITLDTSSSPQKLQSFSSLLVENSESKNVRCEIKITP